MPASPRVPAGPLARLLRSLVFRLVALFYHRIEVRGTERLPDGPAVFVLNHPNGLLDPLLLMAALGRPVAFLAKSTFFAHPLGHLAMRAFGALPVYRRRDAGQRGGAEGASDAAVRNEATFARCRALLHAGGAMALFPEGTTHSEPQLMPLRTGAARIALGAEAEAGFALGLRVVPVGLWYEDKTRFRSAVVVAVGAPFTLTAEAAAYREAPRQAVDAVTERIDAALDAVVLQAENAELLSAIPVVAAWTAPAGGGLARRHAWSVRLLDAYHHLHRTDPARLQRIAAEARRYAGLLADLGVADPWTLERPAPRRRGLVLRVLALGVAAPLALAGWLMSYAPYRLAGPLAVRVTGGEAAVLGTVKLIAGAVLVPAAWLAEAAVAGALWGWAWGAGLLLLAPAAAYAALRWGEAWHRLRALASYRGLHRRRASLVALLAERRRALAQTVADAVEAPT